MNRIVVRLLTAFLTVIAFTALSQLAAVVFIGIVIARGIPQASLQKVGKALQQAFETIHVSPSTEDSYILLALLFGSVIVAALLAVFLARRIALPLEAVSRAASRVAQGDWQARAPLHPREARGGSETARLVRNFNSMASSLEGLEAERKATVAAIAHELRTPLTVLRGRLEAVRDGVLETTPEEFSVLISQVELLSRLVTDLRTLSLMEAGQLSLERQELDFALLVRSVALGFQTKASEKHLRLEVRADELVPLSVDAERLHQVIANLLENAVRYTSEGFVRVSLEAELSRVTLRVRDSGGGIPAEALPHIFERFYRAESSRARVSGGSGLGLAIVQAIVTLHGGNIEARNHPEGGAEFTVTLPRHGSSLVATKQVTLQRRRLQPVTPVKDGFIAPGSFTAALYHAISFPLGLLYFILIVVGGSVGLATSILGVGLVILLLTFIFITYAANLERWLNDSLLGVPVAFTAKPMRGNLFKRLTISLRDPMTWRSLVYLTVKFPFSLVSSVTLLILGVLSAGLVLSPLIRVFSSQVEITLTPLNWSVKTLNDSLLASVAGVILTVLTFLLSNLSATLWARFARWMLGDSAGSATRASPPQPVLER